MGVIVWGEVPCTRLPRPMRSGEWAPHLSIPRTCGVPGAKSERTVGPRARRARAGTGSGMAGPTVGGDSAAASRWDLRAFAGSEEDHRQTGWRSAAARHPKRAGPSDSTSHSTSSDTGVRSGLLGFEPRFSTEPLRPWSNQAGATDDPPRPPLRRGYGPVEVLRQGPAWLTSSWMTWKRSWRDAACRSSARGFRISWRSAFHADRPSATQRVAKDRGTWRKPLPAGSG